MHSKLQKISEFIFARGRHERLFLKGPRPCHRVVLVHDGLVRAGAEEAIVIYFGCFRFESFPTRFLSLLCRKLQNMDDEVKQR
jgi:hypothetical protein